MPSIFNRYLILLGCCLFTACNDDFLYTPGNADAYLVIEGSLNANGEIRFNLRKSAAVFSDDDLQVPVSGSLARLYVDGAYMGLVSEVAAGSYLAFHTFNPGQKVELVVKHDGFPVASFSDILPGEIPITSVDSTRHTGNVLGMAIRFTDPPQSNFYQLFVDVSLYEYTEFQGTDPIDSVLRSVPAFFTSQNKIFFSENNFLAQTPGLQLFSDRFVSPGPFDLNINVHLDFSSFPQKYGPAQAIRIRFRNITESHYRTLTGFLLNNGVYGGPFSHNVNVDDNISNGFGLMQCFWERSDTLTLSR